MMWPSHKITAFATTYAFTGNIIASALAMFGSILPDVLELGGLIKHRTLTHWMYIYLVPFIWFLMLREVFPGSGFYFVVCFLLLGALLHLFCDAFGDSGIPVGLNPFGKHRGFYIYYTYCLSELVFVAGLVGSSILVSLAMGYLSKPYLLSQVFSATQYFMPRRLM